MYTDSLYNKETINKDKTYRSRYYHKINMTQKRNSVGVHYINGFTCLPRIGFGKNCVSQKILGKGVIKTSVSTSLDCRLIGDKTSKATEGLHSGTHSPKPSNENNVIYVEIGGIHTSNNGKTFCK